MKSIVQSGKTTPFVSVCLANLARQAMHYISSMTLLATLTKGQSSATVPSRFNNIVIDVNMRHAGGTRHRKFVLAAPSRYVSAAQFFLLTLSFADMCY